MMEVMGTTWSFVLGGIVWPIVLPTGSLVVGIWTPVPIVPTGLKLNDPLAPIVPNDLFPSD